MPASDTCKRLTRRPDVLLTDVVMPSGLQGPTLARRLKDLQPGLEVLFMSGRANAAAINGDNMRPDDVFLMKLIQSNALLAAITKLARPTS